MKHYTFLMLALLLSISVNAVNPPTEGTVAPKFKGVDQFGETISSDDLLKKGPVVLIFYRGNWCPHCKRHLSALQDSLSLIVDKGANVVVVTPEKPAAIDSMVKKVDATFSIIYDKGYTIMNDYGVAFTISKETVTSHYEFVKTATALANGNNEGVLPVPATYVINKKGKVVYAQYDPDYKNRSKVVDILKVL